MQLVFKLPWDLLAHEVDLLEIVVAQPSVVLVAEQPRRATDDAGQVERPDGSLRQRPRSMRGSRRQVMAWSLGIAITGDRLAVTPLLVA